MSEPAREYVDQRVQPGRGVGPGPAAPLSARCCPGCWLVRHPTSPAQDFPAALDLTPEDSGGCLAVAPLCSAPRQQRRHRLSLEVTGNRRTQIVEHTPALLGT